MSTRNPAWVRDELILALDLYFRHRPDHVSKSHPEVIALSQLLKKLPVHASVPDPEAFRSPSSVYMKLSNFLPLDPTYLGTGLDAGSRMDKVIWDQFAQDRPRLQAVAGAIRTAVLHSTKVPDQADAKAHEVAEAAEGEEQYPEGAIVFRVHFARERNHAVVQKKKEQALERAGALGCEVCGFVYTATYGALGDGFIECHHRTPVSQMKPGQQTSAADLALVCADCHRMLHRGGELLTVEALRDIVLARLQAAPGADM